MKFSHGSLTLVIWLATQISNNCHGFSTLHRNHRSSTLLSHTPRKTIVPSSRLFSSALDQEDVLESVPNWSDYNTNNSNHNSDFMYSEDEINEWTKMLLSSSSNSASIDPNIIMPVCSAWCQTCSFTGAIIIERILKRYHQLSTNKMYTVVSIFNLRIHFWDLFQNLI